LVITFVARPDAVFVASAGGAATSAGGGIDFGALGCPGASVRIRRKAEVYSRLEVDG
jgi:hypothetical protein